ncbi:hypothetical protein Pfo_024477 [Paulownia fortunei]|nr:hypothetical protein Pfo_024477 [Paulownia fortunei]
MKFVDWYLKIAIVLALIGGSMELFMIKRDFLHLLIKEALNPWRDRNKQTRKSS